MSLQFISVEKRIHDSIIFSSFNLSIHPGQGVAIYSSVNIREQLMGLLLGDTTPSSGEVKIVGDQYTECKQSLGFLFLDNGLYERLTIEEMINFTKRLYSSTLSVDEVIGIVQLRSKRKMKIKKLSYSESKRVQLACLLVQNPDVYIFEEADQNLDLESKRIFLTVLQELKKKEKGALVLTGNMESAVTVADQIFRLDENGLHAIHTHDMSEEQPTIDETITLEESIQPVRFEKIPTKVNDKIVLFDPTEIDYIESSEGQSFLHIKGESFPANFILNELEGRLLPFGFFRCHRSYIVNLQKVREVITWTRNSYSLVLDDKEKSTIPLSKTKMAELKEMLGL